MFFGGFLFAWLFFFFVFLFFYSFFLFFLNMYPGLPTKII